jgi:hypothetical protein
VFVSLLHTLQTHSTEIIPFSRMSAEQQRLKKTHREAVILAEAKKVLGFPVSQSAASPVTSAASASKDVDGRAAVAALTTAEGLTAARQIYEVYGLSMTAVNAYLLRYLRSKHLSVDDALAKLRRRRVFERTLPTISVTPTTVAALRSGALHLLGNDLEGRPILYVNMSAFTLPTLELDEAQRLLVILLEFMQAQCLLKNNEDDAVARQEQAAAAAAGKPAGAQTVQEAEKEVTRHLQQFTLLINEEGAPWGTHESFLRNSGTFFSMFPKYYPMMLGTVLVIGASFEVRMAIKACVGNSPDDVRDAVRMIDRPDLARFMSPHTIPVELGGQKQIAGSAMNFSEAVLRHWFTLTSQMEEENATPACSATSVSAAALAGTTTTAKVAGSGEKKSGAESDDDRERRTHYQRPLYVPPPPLATTQQLIARQRRTIELQHLIGAVSGVAGGANEVGKDTRSRHASPHRDAQKSANVGTSHSKSAASVSAQNGNDPLTSPLGTRKEIIITTAVPTHPSAQDSTDDGVCSELSAVDDEEQDVSDNDEAHEPSGSPLSNGGPTTNQMHTVASLSAVSEEETEFHNGSLSGAATYTAAGAMNQEEISHFTANPEAAVAALRRERQRRAQAEQALQFRDLGVTLNLCNATTIEKELAALHQDLNVLVAEVLVKAEAAGKRQKAPPTLNQLLDITLTAFEGATSMPSTVPAMALAQPRQREAVSSGCCSFM